MSSIDWVQLILLAALLLAVGYLFLEYKRQGH